ncbi:uncharacterized protein LOC108028007 [Drosophila biarmipes]|uniref:uncharacterized protein LOC108028007 n=1 Tax=Drosophila biarmipes TaxID=125945 RepID=UPI0007E7349D|nr:uncharacterized protein LOC108028007 [Drosophila biarmipes]
MASPSSRGSGLQGNPSAPPVPPRPEKVPRPSMLQYEPQESQKASRSRFIVLVYLLVVVILLLALVQWELVSLYKPLTNYFLTKYWLSVGCMLIAVPLLAVFLILRKARYTPILSWVLLCVIIELMVIGICTLAAYCTALYFLLWFTLTALLVVTFVLIGSLIPSDLTANVAVLFLVSMQLFWFGIFLLMIYVIVESGDGFFYAFAFMVLGIVGMFLMYHAQLIRGWRYAELYTTDGLLAVIILFCHFCIILMLFCFCDWLNTKDEDDLDSGEARVTAGIEDPERKSDELGLRVTNTNGYFEGVINL